MSEQVTDAISGQAISDARVTVTAADGELIGEATSDRDGGYEIDGLGVGAHTLSADADGYTPASQPIDVERNETTSGDLTLASEGPALPAGAGSRVAGPDRFATAARLSTASFEPGVPAAYVATGGRFADALTGGGAAELDRLEPQRVAVVGGPAAVSAEVADELAAFTDDDVDRLAGPDRFATAAAVARASYDGTVDTAYVAAGSGFADALAGAPGPLLLAAGDALPPATAAELDRLDPDRIVVLGGTAVVSEATEAALADHGDVDRIAGAARYDTAAAFAVAVAGSEHAPMLLVTAEAVPTATAGALDQLEPDRIVVMGGPATVSDPVAAELERSLPSSE